MKFISLLLISLIIVSLFLFATGIKLLLGRKSALKAGSCGTTYTTGKKDSVCGCGMENCCAAE
jgi:hypothetical protein